MEGKNRVIVNWLSVAWSVGRLVGASTIDKEPPVLLLHMNETTSPLLYVM